MNRRRFLGGLAGGGMAAPAAETPPVRVAVVGVGQRGAGLLRTLLMLDGVEITAAADLNETRLAAARRLCQDAGRTAPAAYAKGPEDYRRLVERPDVDIVIAATPWEWHTPVMLAAMDAGKAAATEVPAGVTVEDCWALVEKSEKTGAHCTMLENWVFRREPLAVLNMARAGLLGEVFHCECGYNHDVRYTKFDTPDGNRGELRWRGVHTVKRNGSLYPTHSLAPPALLMDVNRGTRMEYLVSMSTPSRGMNEYAARRWGKDHPNARRAYRNGDVTVTLIKLANGNTITLYHDTQSWRPRDDAHRYHGARGMVRWPYPEKGSAWFLDRHWNGKQHAADRFRPLDEFLAEFDHPLWKKHGARAAKTGHNGSDWMELYALVEAVRRREPPVVAIADAATWSVVAPLSEASLAGRSRAVDFPDFTRGKWKTAPPFELKREWAA